MKRGVIMPNATLSLVYFANGPHRRQPRSAGGPGGFTLVQSFPLGNPSGGTFIPPPVQKTLPVGSAVYNFAFMNVSGGYSSASGGAPIGLTTTDNLNLNPNISVFVQNLPIVALAVYVPPGGGPNGLGPSGATIDSFNQTTGSLFDDTFVAVSPDKNGALTTSGNVEGYVDTTSSTETIRALSPTSPTGVDFEQWVLLGPPATFSAGAGLTVDKGVSVSALAFYKTPPPLTECQTLLKNYDALEPKTNVGLLSYYLEKLSACSGPQYTAATDSIKALLEGLRNPPR
jgi:hypothetical protein